MSVVVYKTFSVGEVLTASDLNNSFTRIVANIQAATTSATGVSERALDAEAVTGTDTERHITPANLTARLAAPGAIGGTTPAVGTFSAVGGGITPTFKLHSHETANATSAWLNNAYASLTLPVVKIVATRAANAAYDLLMLSSGGGADSEFRFIGDGNGKCDGSWTGGGTDYAIYFEWEDGNPDGEDRRGISVVPVGDKVRRALPEEQPIGVETGNPAFVEGAAWNKWHLQYLRDDFGTYIMEDYEAVEWFENGKAGTEEVLRSYAADEVPNGITVPKNAKRVTQQRRKLNPDFDPDLKYNSREVRPEWSPIAREGKVRILKGESTNENWIKLRDVSATVEEWLI